MPKRKRTTSGKRGRPSAAAAATNKRGTRGRGAKPTKSRKRKDSESEDEMSEDEEEEEEMSDFGSDQSEVMNFVYCLMFFSFMYIFFNIYVLMFLTSAAGGRGVKEIQKALNACEKC